ncbi:unnamed protein product [Caenorhabditis angaria]|uniref:Aminopeptidase N-like N-terminal domain-containing protein n=1 Tax=Caenorhabditis angaria TaxID=860376 RepID=A0A9P1NBZ0_9PELO|nr:unnamed protein product [Caenorhabditis angaria]
MVIIFFILNILTFIICDVPRLPDHIKPLSYDLQLEVYLPGYSIEPQYFGIVSIELDIKRNVNNIILHANKNIIFSQTVLEFSNPDESSHYTISPIKITDSDEFQQVKLHFDKTIPAGKALLTIEYSSNFNNDMMGFYNFSYKNEAGKLQYGALTQFEPYSARSAIPCFDEPEFKAIWKVDIYHPKGTNALSNTPGIRTTPYGAGSEKWENFTYTTFEETPEMSSYLLAFAISEYVYESAETKSGILVNVHAPFESTFLIKSRLGGVSMEAGFSNVAILDISHFFRKSYLRERPKGSDPGPSEQKTRDLTT